MEGGWIEGWMEGRVGGYGWMDGGMDKWRDGGTEGQTDDGLRRNRQQHRHSTYHSVGLSGNGEGLRIQRDAAGHQEGQTDEVLASALSHCAGCRWHWGGPVLTHTEPQWGWKLRMGAPRSPKPHPNVSHPWREANPSVAPNPIPLLTSLFLHAGCSWLSTAPIPNGRQQDGSGAPEHIRSLPGSALARGAMGGRAG